MNQEDRKKLVAQVTNEAALAYTSGPQRQVLYVAGVLLRKRTTESELVDLLGPFVKELTPSERGRLSSLIDAVGGDR